MTTTTATTLEGPTSEELVQNSVDWKHVVDAELKIAMCSTCRAVSGDDPGSPQTSWIGERYATGGVA
jgi:hypothetical protein